MPHSRFSREEIERRGEQFYDQTLREQVETEENIGKIITIDIETGDYEIGEDLLPNFTEITANLTDDTNVKTDVHPATILWNAEAVEVAVLAMGRRPLLGTALLAQKNLNIDFDDGRSARITSLL